MKETKKQMLSMRCDEKMLDDLKLISSQLKLSQRETVIYLMDFYNKHVANWKSVKEQLPPVDETVLLLLKDCEDDEHEYFSLGYLEFYEYEQKWLFRDLEYTNISSIVRYWMNIPPI